MDTQERRPLASEQQPPTSRPMTIGKLARAAAVGVETIRFYERRGLLPPPPRSAAGYRHYGPDALRRLRFIQRAKELGFSLDETAELLALRADASARCDDVRSAAAAKLRDVEAKLRDLVAIRDTLTELVERCGCQGPSSPCPILEALDHDATPT